MTNDLERLKTVLEAMYDPSEILELLEMDARELLDRSEDKLTAELYDEYCGIEESNNEDDDYGDGC